VDVPVVARILPDVSGIDREFDYLVPETLVGELDIGDRVRVVLNGRRVAGWVTAIGEPDERVPIERLRTLAQRIGIGPDAQLVELARFVSHRWSGRLRSVLVSATPDRVIRALPGVDRTAHRHPHMGEIADPTTEAVLARGGGLVRLPPVADLLGVVVAALAHGPTLVVSPSLSFAEELASRVRGLGASTAVVPRDWARAAAGVDAVFGARSATWARCQGLASIVLLDEHDEAHQEERVPTWHARDVLVERARRAAVPFVAVSPCPTVVGLSVLGEPASLSRADERTGWPVVDVVDRRREEPWKTSLVTSAIQPLLADPRRHVVLVHNVRGRARVTACGGCRSVHRCERCDAAVAAVDESNGTVLACPRCGQRRPPVCLRCGSAALRIVRPGVTRLREELEAAARRSVVEVDARNAPDSSAGVHVGTEAVLHRVRDADTVVFLDFDAELLAPRYRAAEQAFALVARAARLVGRSTRSTVGDRAPGKIVLQTTMPEHEVVRAAQLADPARLARAESSRRTALRLPPAGSVARISGAGSDTFADSLRAAGHEVQGPADGAWLVRSIDAVALAELLAGTPRPPKSRLRIEVDPPRI
jgi:primosomal protein N' (replication factor Y) (superfamily II helicase)